jgi:hypothetical protein
MPINLKNILGEDNASHGLAVVDVNFRWAPGVEELALLTAWRYQS